MIDDSIKTLEKQSEGIYKDKGSKFIGVAMPVESEEEIKEQLVKIKKQYHDARHHCYAYALGINNEIYRINDDGEPSGTAGKPIYGQILSFQLSNVLIIVVRYFGGTKLGVRGLINAYKGAAKDAILNNNIIEKYLCNVYKIEFKYDEMNDVMRIIKEYKLDQFNHDFSETCTLKFSIRQSLAEQVVSLFSSVNNLKIKRIESMYS
ncbi:MAG: IMPACT family protein [Bacteroidota bacterium]